MSRPVVVVMLCVALLLCFGDMQANPSSQDPFSTIALDDPRLKDPVLSTDLMRLILTAQETPASDQAVAQRAETAVDDRVFVEITVVDDPLDVVEWLTAHGATDLNWGRQIVEGLVPLRQLQALAQLPDVLNIQEPIAPQSLVTSQGVAGHGVPNWRAEGFTGSGIKVGVIDVGFQQYRSLIGIELPDPVIRCYPQIGAASNVWENCERKSVHGTAVVETLVDVAPGATFYIANPNTKLQLNQTVLWMIAEGVQIINHSVGWGWEGPGDGTSQQANGALAAVTTASNAGVVWINAAGNSALSNWSGGYVDVNGNGIIEFFTGQESNHIDLRAGQPINLELRWEDSWLQAQTDLDLYLVDGAGNQLAASRRAQSGVLGEQPYENLSYTAAANERVYVRIRHYSGRAPAWIQVQDLSQGTLGINTPTFSITNPAESAATGMLAVGAAPWYAPDQIAAYSSQGPTRDGRLKPDIVGLDQATTAVYGDGGFIGTSQAAPHVSGLAAMVLQRYPEMTADEVKQYLQQRATKANAPNTAWGYGLAQLPPIAPGDNPLPNVDSVEPAMIPIDALPMMFTVRGSRFIPTTVVYWNGEQRPTTYIDSATLMFTANADEDALAGANRVVVVTPGPGGGPSAAGIVMIIDTSLPGIDWDGFQRTWQRTDQPVKEIAVSRTWMWGDGALTGARTEAYEEGVNGVRSVKYYDKSRMEVTDPTKDPLDPWLVTNGLLSRELITGAMQMGDNDFRLLTPAQVPVAGDGDDEFGPTYATFHDLLDTPAAADGAVITERLARDGTVTDDPALAAHGVTAAYLVDVPDLRHQVASPFWAFMNSTGLVYVNGELRVDALFENPFYATGFPITEAYWAQVKVADEHMDVLMQCFERRCLTYTPENPAGWQVEAGNVGLHYYIWRYGEGP